MTRQKETEDRDEVLKKLGKHTNEVAVAIGGLMNIRSAAALVREKEKDSPRPQVLSAT